MIVTVQIAIREFLHITLDFDDDFVDGTPIARFISGFKELVEGSNGLVDLQ